MTFLQATPLSTTPPFAVNSPKTVRSFLKSIVSKTVRSRLEKDGEVGYAIYRIIDGELINLFGEDMEDCC